MIAMRFPRLAEKMTKRIQANYMDPMTNFFMHRYKRVDYLANLDERIIEEISFHLKVVVYQFNQEILTPGQICDHVFFIMKGVVEIYIQSGNEQVVIDYLGKGSVVGQYSILGREKTLFGMRAVLAGTTSVLCLGRETFETLRMKRQEVDQALLYAEDFIDKQGVPQIDFLMINENNTPDETQVDQIEDMAKHRRMENFKKLRRAMRRLCCLARAARKQGNPDFNIGGLVFEVSEQKDIDAQAIPGAWIEIVISQLDMTELISKDLLLRLRA